MDAKIDAYIAGNPGLLDYYLKQDKMVLARKLVLNKMRWAESMARKANAFREVVDASPELKAKVEARLAQLPPERRASAFVNIAKSALADQMVAAQRNGPSLSA